MAVTAHSRGIMPPARDTEMFFAQAFEAGLYRQIDVLCYILGLKHLDLPSNIAASIYNPVIVGLDAEWFERDPHPITELGIAMIDLHNFQYKAKMMQHPLGYVYDLEAHHVRFIDNAHMINGQLCEGHPEDFQFGNTRFITKSEGQRLLRASFLQHSMPTHLNPYPYRFIIFVGHAVANDIEFMHSHLDVDLSAIGTIACTLDTQVLAQELGLVRAPTKISLKRLLETFSINEPYLHNAGNDIAQTLIAAALMCHEHVHPGSALVHPSNQQAVDYLKTTCSYRADMYLDGLHTIGIPQYCTRCDARTHKEPYCRIPVMCAKCANHPRHSENSHTHTTAKCPIAERPRVIIPCEACSLSKDPKRWRKATTHAGEDCYFASSSEFENEGRITIDTKAQVNMEVVPEMARSCPQRTVGIVWG